MKTVFTNGVWDIFHYGHYNLLRRAKDFGDYLLVGVASDESCEKYKREPNQPWHVRANSVKNLNFVNEVIKTEWSRDLDEKFYKRYDINYQVQGDGGSGFHTAEKLGILKIIGRTKGVSTTKIENVLEKNTHKGLEGGFINDIKQSFADNKLYVIKQGQREKGRIYNIDAPACRIYNEYESIMSFRSSLNNPKYIVNPICFDADSYTIVFESAPKQAGLLSQRLLENRVDKNQIVKISKSLADMHNSTLNNTYLMEKFNETECFKKFKIQTQCYNINTDDKTKEKIREIVNNSLKIKKVLLHGDVAPKNILVWDDNFLFIDFEESSYSDPAIDISYLIAHFNLYGEEFYDCAKKVYDTYMSNIKYYDPDFEDRISKYVGIFMLSRVDGKAKANFIDDERKDKIRDISKKLIFGKIKNTDLHDN